jgi:large subunit ribosomal protein L17
MVFSYLQDKNAVAELFREVSPKIADRPGGYTRILKTGNRQGDNADMCILELVDFNEAMLTGGDAAKTKTTTRRRRPAAKKKGEAEETKAPAAKAKQAEAPAAEKPADEPSAAEAEKSE